MTQLVWVADWQVQCCGKEFAVGDQVSWPLVRTAAGEAAGEWEETLGAELAAQLTLTYDAHEDSPVPEVAATVRGIRTVSWRTAPHPPPAHPREHFPVAGSAVLEPVAAIDLWYDSGPGAQPRFAGWLVEVELA